MLCATAFSPLKGNHAIEPFRLYLDRLVAEDRHFNKYVDYRETSPFDNIVLYSGWLTYGSRLTPPHFYERVMSQFNYTQAIPRHHIVSAHSALKCRQMDVMFDDYKSQLVPEEAHSTIVVSEWSYVDRYIMWFFRVTSVYGTRYSRRSIEVNSSEDTRGGADTIDHAKDVLPRCHCIMEIEHEGIDKGIFPDGSDVRQVLNAIMTKARETLMYRRQRQRTKGIEGR